MVKIYILNLTGTLSGNRTLTMPATTTGGTATRVFVVEDATVRGTSNRTLSVLTTGSSASVAIPTRWKSFYYILMVQILN